ncbi:NAD(P)H-binding protein [Mesorhizobium sp. LjNodule214]|uniref:SDR family oxidoreductase n=1 Tax=Mesorhizobium sp. LjNodule214 TaxID=3342252 RepID=UPI003ECE6878
MLRKQKEGGVRGQLRSALEAGIGENANAFGARPGAVAFPRCSIAFWNKSIPVLFSSRPDIRRVESYASLAASVRQECDKGRRAMDPDDPNKERIVTVFGGTGFLGRRIVKRLLERGFTVRAATRHSARVGPVFSSNGWMPEAVEADILDASSIGSAIAGSERS